MGMGVVKLVMLNPGSCGENRELAKGSRVYVDVSRLALLFEGAENEELVLNDGPAKRSAVLIPMEFGIGLARSRKRLGIQATVLKQAECRTVVLIGAGLRNHVNDSPDSPS